MGFRCPKCHRDCGVDKKALEEHMPQCGSVTLNDLVEAIDANTEDVTKVVVLQSMLAGMRQTETWHTSKGDVEVPKGVFDKIHNDDEE